MSQMKKRFVIAVATAALLGALGGSAQAGAGWCDIMEKVGVRNVRECEDPTS